MAIGGVVINFVAKTAGAVTDTKKLSRALGGLQGSADKAGGKSGVGGLVSSMGAAVPVIGAIAIGAVGAAVAMVEMGQAALADRQEARKLEQTLRTIPGVTDAMVTANAEWIDSMQIATLVSDTQLRAAVSRLTLATGDLTEAQRLTALAVDVSAGSGVQLTTVTTALAKAVNGNTGALTRHFPWLDANHDGTVTLTEATTGLAGAFSGAAEAAADNDPFRRLKVIWDELKEAVGQGLLPILDDLSAWFKDPRNQRKIQEMIDKVAAFAKETGDKAVRQIREFIDWLKSPSGQQAMKDFKEGLEDVTTAVRGVTSAITGLVGWIQTLISWWNRIPSPLRNLITGGERVGLGSLSSTGASASVGPQTTATATAGVTVQHLTFYGSGDVAADARRLKRILEAGDVEQGRPRGAPLRVAW